MFRYSRLSDHHYEELQVITAISAFRCVLTELRRTFLYKLLFVSLTIVFQLSLVVAIQYDLLFVASSPALGYNDTSFLVGNISPIYFFLLHVSIIAIVLLYVTRVRSNDVLEPVQAKPFSNASWSIGTVLGISLLVFAIPFLNFTVLFCFFTTSETSGIELVSAPELLSSLNLILVDVPVSILFYSALVLVIQRLVRHPILGGFIALLVAAMHLVLISSSSHTWKQIVSHSTTDSLLVSNLLPQFTTTGIMFNRTMWLFLAIGLVFLLGVLDARRDTSRQRYSYLTLACLIGGLIGFGVHGLSIHLETKNSQRIASTHEVASTSSWLDLQSIQGNVSIAPGDLLFMQLDLQVKAVGTAMPNSLQFSFNPGMRLEQLLLDGAEREFLFQDGLIDIPLQQTDATKREWTVSITARGLPDVNFGYLNPRLDYLRVPGMSAQVPKLLGVQISIFNHDFVALMPGTRWHPVPMALGSAMHIQSHALPVDTYEINIDVYIQGKDWRVAAPGQTTYLPYDLLRHRIQSTDELPNLAIIASRFNSLKFEESEFEIEILTHKNHRQWDYRMERALGHTFSDFPSRILELSRMGFELPYRKLTFVEVPNHLRLVGGHEMPLLFSQPGVIMFRESGLPIADFERVNKSLHALPHPFSEEQLEQMLFDHISTYAVFDVLDGNMFEAMLEQYVPFLYHPRNPVELTLNYIRSKLIASVLSNTDSGYVSTDLDFVMNVADVTSIHPAPVLERLLQIEAAYYPDEKISFAATMGSFDSEDSFSVQDESVSSLLQGQNRSLRSATIAHRLAALYAALEKLHGRENLGKVLQSLDTRSSNDSSLNSHNWDTELKQVSESVLSLITEWNESTEAPAFSVSEPEFHNVSVEDSSLKQRVSFKIRNDSSVTGVVGLELRDFGYSIISEHYVKIPKHSAFQVSLYSEDQAMGVTLQTLYSKNLGLIQLLSFDPSSLAVEGDPEKIIYPTLVEIDWDPHSARDTVIVDNLDPGFTLLKRKKQKSFTFMERVRWPWESPRTPRRFARGMETFDLLEQDVSAEWRISLDPWANNYGRYRPSAVVAAGSNVETVRFSAEIPTSGKWSLAYWFPANFLEMPRRSNTHNFVLRHAQHETAFQADLPDLGGWTNIGEFDLSDSVVELDLVSVDPPDSIRMADAIKWTLTEEFTE